MSKAIKVNQGYSYKIGIDEVVGLKRAMIDVMKPIQEFINDKSYWGPHDLEETEYKSRDGFIPFSSNCGGIECSLIVPKCEEYNWSFLEFGEWDGTHYCDGKDTENCECPYDNDGEYDTRFRVWLKFEGLDEDTQTLKFYLYASGGNSDAPYFRTKYDIDLFEVEFTCKSVSGLKRAASKHVKQLLKKMGA